MISVYKDGSGGLQEATAYGPGTWVHAENPTERELDDLHDELDVPEAFLYAALDQHAVARTDSRRGASMVIVRVPYHFGEDDRVPFRTVPLGIVVATDHLITIGRHPMDFVRDLNYSYREAELPTDRQNRMILAILGVVAERFLSTLEQVENELEEVEEDLKDSIENREMLDLLRYTKSLVHLRTGLEWNQEMIRHLEESREFNWRGDDKQMLKDVQTEYSQALHVAVISQTVLGETADAYASLISNNLSVVMKFMAAVTIVLTVPALVFAFFQMNVQVPLAETATGFVVALVITVVASVAAALWFFRRGWLSLG